MISVTSDSEREVRFRDGTIVRSSQETLVVLCDGYPQLQVDLGQNRIQVDLGNGCALESSKTAEGIRSAVQTASGLSLGLAGADCELVYSLAGRKTASEAQQQRIGELLVALTRERCLKRQTALAAFSKIKNPRKIDTEKFETQKKEIDQQINQKLAESFEAISASFDEPVQDKFLFSLSESERVLSYQIMKGETAFAGLARGFEHPTYNYDYWQKRLKAPALSEEVPPADLDQCFEQLLKRIKTEKQLSSTLTVDPEGRAYLQDSTSNPSL